MCLKLTDFQNNKPKIAESDIICYKILRLNEYPLNKGELVTFYQMSPINIGETYSSELIEEGVRCKIINIGLHSFININDVLYHLGDRYKRFIKDDIIYDGLTIPSGVTIFTMNWYGDKDGNKIYSNNCLIAECVIPEGSTYYEGVFGNFDYPSYASDKLKYVKLL